MADGQVTIEEVEELQTLVDDLGLETYQELLGEATLRIDSKEAAHTFLGTIKRQEAREYIFGVVMKMAMADTVDQSESDMLDWLTEAWHIQVVFESPPG